MFQSQSFARHPAMRIIAASLLAIYGGHAVADTSSAGNTAAGTYSIFTDGAANTLPSHNNTGQNSAIRLASSDSAAAEITGVSIEAWQGKPFTVIYADDDFSTNTPIVSSTPPNTTASVVVYDGGGSHTNSSNTWVSINAGANQLKVAGNGVTLNGSALVTSGDLSGYAQLSGAAFTGAVSINNTLSSTSSTTLGSGAGSTNTIGAAGSSTNTIQGDTNTLTGVTNNMIATTANNITGVTNINASANNATNINTGMSTGSVTIGNSANTTTIDSGTTNIGTAGGNTNIGNASSTNTVLGTTSVTGATTINTTGTAATTLGANGNTTSLNSSTVNVGTGAYTTAVNIGSNQAGTIVNATAGNSVLSLANDTASLRSGTGATASGLTTTAAAQTLSTNATTLANELNNVGDAASRANIAGAQYVNRLEGNTLINGNTYINGTLVYTSNTSASTTVTSGVSVLAGATQATNGQTSIANSGASGALVDANGKITTGIVSQSTASMTLTNGLGNTHGLVVTESQATLSGGTHSTSLTLTDDGARFSNSATGAPVKVTGVADGTNDFDAVNYRQLKSIAAGVASTAAMANIPTVDRDRDFAIGVGVGNYMGQTSLAAGASYRFAPNGIVKASLATGVNGGASKTAAGVGLGWSF